MYRDPYYYSRSQFNVSDPSFGNRNLKDTLPYHNTLFTVKISHEKGTNVVPIME
jgi:hypothetical protein